MRDMVNLSLRLLIISLVAALALAGTNMITKDPIEQQKIETADAARREVIQADTFEQVDKPSALPGWDESLASVSEEGVYKAMAGGQMVGVTIELSAKGYGGDIVMTVGVSAEGAVTGVTINSHSETASLGSRVTEEDFRSQFDDKDAAQEIGISSTGEGNDISAISGATISSTAVAKGVSTAGKAAMLVIGGEGQ